MNGYVLYALLFLFCVAAGAITLAESAVDAARGNKSQAKSSATVAGVLIGVSLFIWFLLRWAGDS